MQRPQADIAAMFCRGMYEGLGVDDIAVREEVPVAQMRAEMQRAQKEGRLPWILSHARRRYRKELQRRGVEDVR